MRRTVVLAFVASLATLSAASAARAAAPHLSLARAVSSTDRVSTLRYVITISVTRKNYPAVMLRVDGTRSRTSLAVHEMSAMLAGGTTLPGPHQSAIIDGPFLYEGSPNGVAIDGKIRWLRVPVARIGQEAPAISAVRNLSPSPLLHLLDEWTHAKSPSKAGRFSGTVAYDDPIVLAALSGMTNGVEFRDIRFSAQAGADGYLHTIRVTGKTADGLRTLEIEAHLYAFGRPVRLKIPAEGTFMDQKLLYLEE